MPLFEAEAPGQWGRPLPGQHFDAEVGSCLLVRTLWHGPSSGPLELPVRNKRG